MAQIEELLEEIEDILADAKGKAFSSKMTVDVDALKTVIEDIRLSVPEEIKQARVLASERREIMNRANREASEIIESARGKSRDLLMASEKRAHENDAETNRRNEELIREAQIKAKSIIDSARLEADRLVSQENIVTEAKIAADNLTQQAESLMEDKKQQAIEILTQAKKRAEMIERDAQDDSKAQMDAATKWSHDLKMNASTYVEDLITDTEYRVSKSLNEIRKLQDNLTAASKKSSQTYQRTDAAPERPTQKKKKAAQNGMDDKHTRNLHRNERDAYGKKRKPVGRSEIVDEDSDIQVIFPKPSIIDIPLDDEPLSDNPIVSDEEMFL